MSLIAALQLCSLPALAAGIATEFIFPVDNYVVTQNFGEFNFGFHIPEGGRHAAEDVRAFAGTRVFAVANGTVKYSRKWDGWGHVLVIEHLVPDGRIVQSIYGHLNPDTLEVGVGIDVNIHDPIGEVGSWSFPNHLHFGIREGGFGPADALYPDWLTGYLKVSIFPENYCDPFVFIDAPIQGVCTTRPFFCI